MDFAKILQILKENSQEVHEDNVIHLNLKEAQDQKDCNYCDNSRLMLCKKCEGNGCKRCNFEGMIRCPQCNALTEDVEYTTNHNEEKDAKRTGEKLKKEASKEEHADDCQYCGGTGEQFAECPSGCNGADPNCKECDGNGYNKHEMVVCDDCAGTGKKAKKKLGENNMKNKTFTGKLTESFDPNFPKKSINALTATLHDSLSLVVLGAGGHPQEWVDGISKQLIKEGIAGSAPVFSDAFMIEGNVAGEEGRSDLALIFSPHADVNVGRLAIWRLHSAGSIQWGSDFVTNHEHEYSSSVATSLDAQVEDDFDEDYNHGVASFSSDLDDEDQENANFIDADDFDLHEGIENYDITGKVKPINTLADKVYSTTKVTGIKSFFNKLFSLDWIFGSDEEEGGVRYNAEHIINKLKKYGYDDAQISIIRKAFNACVFSTFKEFHVKQKDVSIIDSNFSKYSLVRGFTYRYFNDLKVKEINDTIRSKFEKLINTPGTELYKIANKTNEAVEVNVIADQENGQDLLDMLKLSGLAKDATPKLDDGKDLLIDDNIEESDQESEAGSPSPLTNATNIMNSGMRNESKKSKKKKVVKEDWGKSNWNLILHKMKEFIADNPGPDFKELVYEAAKECAKIWGKTMGIQDINEATRQIEDKFYDEANKVANNSFESKEFNDMLRLSGLLSEATAEEIKKDEDEETWINEPNEQVLDTETQLVGMSGGLNGPKAQINPFNKGDNAMTIAANKKAKVEEALTAKYKDFLEESENAIRSICECESDNCDHDRMCKRLPIGSYMVTGFRQSLCPHCVETAKRYCKQSGEEFNTPNISEHIEKLPNGKYQLRSKKKNSAGKTRNLGTFNSRKAAAKHEGEVEYFKHVNESKVSNKDGHKKALLAAGYTKDNGHSRSSGMYSYMDHYAHNDKSFYKVTSKLDDNGKRQGVKSWMYRGKGGSAKGHDDLDLTSHIQNNKKDTPPTKIPRRSSEQKFRDNYVHYD